eukprot:CAMPEP_0185598574 /NCGR_PEP_ID=MMETSP0434-20130131/82091_1 /TAXON_ID=626734 ORGANISM="Favella taraikaensis, Strain Fe Narragansett Bay" /NCGR_SAMPLE_ID=MMETSP0434 /ASSEMBLY_ACC=CAM_ASM_000379 /LENGTH=139 /DNA_ID=CAMNT_0028227609 /DNA_START=335 /DNA_END=754 /DNA_ORIENTATION=-
MSVIQAALNDQGFRGSLKEAYGGKSMQLAAQNGWQVGSEAASDDTQDSDSDEALEAAAEYRLMESYLAQGYKITTKDDKANLYTLERPDEIKCRGRRPREDKYRGTVSLQFAGRVKVTSKKNAQLEVKAKLDGKLKSVF